MQTLENQLEAGKVSSSYVYEKPCISMIVQFPDEMQLVYYCSQRNLLYSKPYLRQFSHRSTNCVETTENIACQLMPSTRHATLATIAELFKRISCDCVQQSTSLSGTAYSYNDRPLKIDPDGLPYIDIVCRESNCKKRVYCHLSSTGAASRDPVAIWESMVFACLGGLDYANYQYAGLHQESKYSFYEKTSVVWKAAEKVAQEHFKQQRTLVAEREHKDTTVQFDGAWATRGFTANDHTFILRDAKHNKVLFLGVVQKTKTGKRHGKEKVLVKGNHPGSSQTMEATGLRMFIQGADDRFLQKLAIIVTDGDMKLPGELEELLQKYGIVHAKDPGHVVKAFIKRLRKVLKDKYDGIYRRIKTSVMRLVKRCEYEIIHPDLHTAHAMRIDAARAGLRLLFAHYTSRPCSDDCICHGKLSLLGLIDLKKFGLDSTIPSGDSIFSSVPNDPHFPIADVDSNNNSDEDDDYADIEVTDRTEPDLPSMPARVSSGNRSTLRKFHDMNRATSEPLQPSAVLQIVSSTHEPTEEKPYLVWTEKDPITDAAKRRKAQFDEMLVVIKEEFELLEITIAPALWGVNTCAAEGSHSRRLKFVDKDKSYFGSFAGRTNLSAYLENVSLREAAESIWSVLRSPPTLSYLPETLSDTFQTRLKALDRKRSADSTRKKSLEYKLQEKKRERQNVERRKAEKASSNGLNVHRSDPLTSQTTQASKKRGRPTGTTKPAYMEQPSSKRATPLPVLSDSDSTSSSKDDADDGISIHESEDSCSYVAMEISDSEGALLGSTDCAMEVDDPKTALLDDLCMVLTEDELLQIAIDNSLSSHELEEENRQLAALVQKDSLSLHDLPQSRDGNCYFRILAYNAQQWTKEEVQRTFNLSGRVTHSKIRSQLVQWTRDHPDTIHTLDTDEGPLKFTLEECTQKVGWKNWLAKIAQDGCYAEDLIVTAASNAFNLRQIIYFGDISETVDPNDGANETTKTIRVALGLKQRHYFAVF